MTWTLESCDSQDNREDSSVTTGQGSISRLETKVRVTSGVGQRGAAGDFITLLETQFKTFELFASGIFYLICLD